MVRQDCLVVYAQESAGRIDRGAGYLGYAGAVECLQLLARPLRDRSGRGIGQGACGVSEVLPAGLCGRGCQGDLSACQEAEAANAFFTLSARHLRPEAPQPSRDAARGAGHEPRCRHMSMSNTTHQGLTRLASGHFFVLQESRRRPQNCWVVPGVCRRDCAHRGCRVNRISCYTGAPHFYPLTCNTLVWPGSGVAAFVSHSDRNTTMKPLSPVSRDQLGSLHRFPHTALWQARRCNRTSQADLATPRDGGVDAEASAGDASAVGLGASRLPAVCATGTDHSAYRVWHGRWPSHRRLVVGGQRSNACPVSAPTAWPASVLDLAVFRANPWRAALEISEPGLGGGGTEGSLPAVGEE